MGFRSGSLFSVSLYMLLPTAIAWGDEPARPAQVKVAAVQMLGYDKTDLPRPGFDPSEAVVPYIDRAAKDGAHSSSSRNISWAGSPSQGRRRSGSPGRQRPAKST